MKSFKSIKSPKLGDTAGLDQGNEFAVSCVSRVSNLYTIYLDACIESPQDMRSACQVFTQASDDDEVIVNLNTPGGSVDATQSFLLAANGCRAHIFYQGSGTIASAGAIILSDAEEYQLHPHCSILFHTASFGTYGPSIDTLEYSLFAKEQMEKFMSFYCAGILTREELNDIYTHKKEMWMNSEEFNTRWVRKQACREAIDSLVEGGTLDAENANTADYTEWMLELTDQYNNGEGYFTQYDSEDEGEACCGNESGCECKGAVKLPLPEIIPADSPKKAKKKE